MKGLLLINAYYNSEEYLYQPRRLQQEFNKLGVETDIRKNDFFPCVVENNDLKYFVKDYDFCVYLDKDKYVLKSLSFLNIPLFNSYQSITVCDDKMMTYIALANKDIPMPKTLPGLLCYSPKEKISLSTVERVEKELSYPLVIKESFGSLGKGVYLINNREELLSVIEEIKCKPYLFQEYIKSSYGKDLRVLLIGGEVVGAMVRSSSGDFRSNLGVGGSGEKCTLSDKVIKLSKRISALLQLEYCGVDFFFGENGEPILCEVNSNAFFKGFEEITGINVAQKYAEYILSKVKKQ